MEIIENRAKHFVPEYPFEYTFVDDAFDSQYRSDRRIGSLFRYFETLRNAVDNMEFLWRNA